VASPREVWLLSSNRYSNRILTFELDVPKFNCCFLSDRIIDRGYQFLSSVIKLAAARSMAPMASYNSLITLTLWLAAKWANSDVITLSRTSLWYLQSCLSLSRFILKSYVSCGMAEMQMVTYFDLVGNEDDIGSERFKWNRASPFSYIRNTTGLAVAPNPTSNTHFKPHQQSKA